MKIDIITLFPELFIPFLEWSMIKKARTTKILKINIHNLRKWGIDKRGSVDDAPYGGGPGMILRIEPIYKALKTLRDTSSKVILLSPKGKTFNQKIAQKFSKMNHLILICGHYEGVDERVRKYLIDEEISIGNYVLSGGEIPAMVIADAVCRLLPGVLEKENASEVESFSPGLSKLIGNNQKLKTGNENLLLEYPQYTRPPLFKNWKVPKVLLSGNHQKILQWRIRQTKTKSL